MNRQPMFEWVILAIAIMIFLVGMALTIKMVYDLFRRDLWFIADFIGAMLFMVWSNRMVKSIK